MSDRRDPAARQLADIRRLKARVATLEAERAEYVEKVLEGRLRHPDDFERFVGLTTVLDDSGRIDWLALERRLAQLLRDRPELAA